MTINHLIKNFWWHFGLKKRRNRANKDKEMGKKKKFGLSKVASMDKKYEIQVKSSKGGGEQGLQKKNLMEIV